MGLEEFATEVLLTAIWPGLLLRVPTPRRMLPSTRPRSLQAAWYQLQTAVLAGCACKHEQRKGRTAAEYAVLEVGGPRAAGQVQHVSTPLHSATDSFSKSTSKETGAHSGRA